MTWLLHTKVLQGAGTLSQIKCISLACFYALKNQLCLNSSITTSHINFLPFLKFTTVFHACLSIITHLFFLLRKPKLPLNCLMSFCSYSRSTARLSSPVKAFLIHPGTADNSFLWNPKSL